MLKRILLYFQLKWIFLLGDHVNFSLESRIFHAFSSFAIITACIETTVNLFDGLYLAMVLTAIVGITQAVGYYMSRFQNKGKLAVIITATEVNLTTAIGYFYTSGVMGSTLLLFVICLFIIILIVKQEQWFLWFSINLIIVMSLIIWEYYQPDIIKVHYSDRRAMFIDIGLAYLIVITLIFVCTVHLRKKYHLQVRLTEEKAISLQQLNIEKDKLFSIISHDLNAPLASLKQYLQLLNDVNMEQTERVLIEDALIQSVENTQELLHNLLHWSKSQMKEVTVNLQELNLEQVLQSTINTFQQIALKKGINMTAAIDRSIFVIADTNMLQLIVRNLINNAIKFTPPRGKISVSALIENNCCVLSISDTGIGIPIEKQDKIFSEDIQSTSGTTFEAGSGLGLVLVRDYTVLQQGKTWFKSVVGKGTTFYVSLECGTTRNTIDQKPVITSLFTTA